MPFPANPSYLQEKTGFTLIRCPLHDTAARARCPHIRPVIATLLPSEILGDASFLLGQRIAHFSLIKH